VTRRILIGLALGVLAGYYLGPAAKPLAEFGKLVIQAIKLAAAPLLMLTIVNAVLTTQISATGGARMAFFATVNATIALCFGLGVSNILEPGRHLSLIAAPAGSGTAAAGKLELARFLSNFVPPSQHVPSS
jgi:Na+/H+-dicarboxylate symporter